jgi:hypothetical protein
MPAAETIVQTREVTVKSTEPAAVEPAAVEPAPMKPAAAVETPAAAMRPSVGEIWLTERGRAQQSSGDGQSPSVAGPGLMFA